jgi:integrase
LAIKKDDSTKQSLSINHLLAERQLSRASERLAAAREDADFQDVGFHCSEVIALLAQAVNLAAGLGENQGLSAKTGFHILRSFVKDDLVAHDSVKGLAASALDVVEEFCRRSTDRRTASMCVAATTTFARVIDSNAGHGDSQHTVAELIRRFLEERGSDIGRTHRGVLETLAKAPIGHKVASRLRPEDILDHCRWRKERGVGPATVFQDVTFLRGVFVAAEKSGLGASPNVIDEAKPLAEKMELLGPSTVRSRRPSEQELSRLVGFFAERDKHPRTKIHLAEVMEFAMWSGRLRGEICRLKWSDVTEENGEYYGALDGVRFPMHQRAWQIIQRQPKNGEFIFPFNDKSLGQSFIVAKKELGIDDLRFQDLRREAIYRLRKSGWEVDKISEAIGRADLNSLRRDLQTVDGT